MREPSQHDVVVVGAGTDSMEGYRLDRGFEVLLTAYPESLAP